MIIQSTNKPIIVECSSVISKKRPIRATLWMRGNVIKEWVNKDMSFYENFIELPLTQNETASFPVGTATLELKWINASGKTEFSDKANISIVARQDRVEFDGYN